MDLDGDGRNDILSGSWPGDITIFRRSGDGFAGGETLKHADGKPVNPAVGSIVFAFDWDGDGKLDLIIGTAMGEVLLASNVGARGQPVFGEAKPLTADGKPIAIPSGDAAPVVADWDGDGKPDLVVGAGDGSVVWFRNAGARKEAKLLAARTLVPPSPSRREYRNLPKPGEWGTRARPCVVDWDGDGKFDLLMGDYNGHFVAKPKATTAEAAEEKDATERLPALRKEWAAAYAEFAKLSDTPEPADREAHRKQLVRLRGQITRLKDEITRLQEIRDDHRVSYMAHGYVWLFRRIVP